MTWPALVLVLVLTCPAIGKEPGSLDHIHIVTPEWKNLTNADGTGLYFELLDMVYRPAGIKVSYRFVPWARAVKYLDSKKADAMLGAYNTVDAFFPVYPLDTEHTAVIFKKGQVNRWEGEKSVENRKVAWVRGYNYHKYLNVPVDYLEVNNSELGWRMLVSDRMEFFMNSLNAIRKYAARNRISLAPYQIKTLLIKNLYVRFAKTEKSKRLIRIYDRQMASLVKSGKIRALYEKWDYQYPDFDSLAN